MISACVKIAQQGRSGWGQRWPEVVTISPGHDASPAVPVSGRNQPAAQRGLPLPYRDTQVIGRLNRPVARRPAAHWPALSDVALRAMHELRAAAGRVAVDFLLWPQH